MSNQLTCYPTYISDITTDGTGGGDPSTFVGTCTINSGDVEIQIDTSMGNAPFNDGTYWYFSLIYTGQMVVSGTMHVGTDNGYGQLTYCPSLQWSLHGQNNWQPFVYFTVNSPYEIQGMQKTLDANGLYAYLENTPGDYDVNQTKQPEFYLTSYAPVECLIQVLMSDVPTSAEFDIQFVPDPTDSNFNGGNATTDVYDSVTTQFVGYLEWDFTPSETIDVAANTYYAGSQTVANQLAYNDFNSQLVTFCNANCSDDAGCYEQTQP